MVEYNVPQDFTRAQHTLVRMAGTGVNLFTCTMDKKPGRWWFRAATKISLQWCKGAQKVPLKD